MITYHKGDVVQAAKDGMFIALVHQCNCFNTMGSGVAKQIAKAFPEAQEVDNKTKKGDRAKLGGLTIAHPKGGPLIFNLYGQYHYGRHTQQTDYDALRQSLKVLESCLSRHAKIGMPRIGCGLAGGDWAVVESIIQECLPHHHVMVFDL